MTVTQLGIPGAWVLEGTRQVDHRGSFTRISQLLELHQLGLPVFNAELSYAHNASAGTVRGMHYQVYPHEEIKLIWCVSGSLFDVLVDLRPESPEQGRWAAVELTATDSIALLVPPGVAHGYQSLEDDTTVGYLISPGYHALSARTLRFDDPSVGIEWPLPVGAISERDATAPIWSNEF